MKRYHLIIIALLPLLLTTGFAQEDKKKDYSEAFQLIEVWLEAQKDFEELPGITAIVVEDQEVLWKGAFGLSNKEDNVKSEPSTLGSICSISKLFTSVAVMKLYDEGKLRLDDRVDDLLPWYDLEQKYPASGPITVRKLMTHSSGLPREANFPYWTSPDFPFPSQDQIREELGNQETLYPSSTYFQYSNLGLTLLGEIVEEVSGVTYDEYIQKNILDPLGLSDTRTRLPEDLYGSQLAVGYTAMTREGSRQKVNLFQANGIAPAAGFSSNVQDLGKFASWQFSLYDTNKAEILKPSTLKEMHNVHWTDPDFETTRGLGFVVYKGPDGSKWVSHGGSCPGYRSILRLHLESKRAYSVMINSSGTSPGKYASGIYGIMEKVKGKQDEDTPSREDLEPYVGYYNLLPWWSEIYISTWEGQLVTLSLPTDDPEESMTFYKHIEGDTFRRVRDNGELGETLTFDRDEDGNISRARRHGNYWRRIDR